MKRKITKCISLLLVILMLISAVPVFALAETTDGGDFTYEVREDSYIEITDYVGEPSDLIIPDSIDGLPVKKIGYGAFMECYSLKSIFIPDSVETIASYVFYSCPRLELINVSENNPYYSSQNGVLYNKEKTELVFYPEGKPESYFKIPEGVTKIDPDAFLLFVNLNIITFPNSITTIESRTFYHINPAVLELPESVVSIADGAFSSSDYRFPLIEVYYHGSQEQWDSISIGDHNECLINSKINFQSVFDKPVYPQLKYRIGDSGVEIYGVIGNDQTVEIPASIAGYPVTDIALGDFWDYEINAFDGCTELQSINVSKDNSEYFSLDGVLFNKVGELCKYPEGRPDSSYTIPYYVDRIYYNAFKNNKHLTSISLYYDHLSNIYRNAFYGCDSLTDVYFYGSEDEWNSMTIEEGNECLTSANIHFIPDTYYDWTNEELDKIEFVADLNAPETEFDKLWVGDEIYFDDVYMRAEKTFGDRTYFHSTWNVHCELTVLSGDCVEVVNDVQMGAGPYPEAFCDALKFTSPGQASVKVKFICNYNTKFEQEKIYTFNVTERPADKPVSVRLERPVINKKVGDYLGFDDGCVAIFENLNYGFDNTALEFSPNDFGMFAGGAGGGAFPLVNADRCVYKRILDLSLYIMTAPGTYNIQPIVCDEIFGKPVESIGEPIVLNIEAPEIKCDLPAQVSAGTTVDFTTELINTALENTDVAKYEDENNYWIFTDEDGNISKHWVGEGFPVAYKPSVTVIDGADCVQQSEQDYGNTLKTSEKLTFVKDGTVKLKITYKQIQTDPYFKACDIEKIITVKVGNGDADPAESVIDSSSVFTDVTTDKWYKEYIDYAVTNRIFNGTTDTTFEPSANMTRAMFVQVLANLEGIDTVNRNVETKFSDVTAGKWYAPAVRWASSVDIVKGVTENTFEPSTNVTREQMCVLLVRYADFKNMKFEEKVEQKVFDDDSEIGKYAHDAVYICQRAGIIDGMTKTTFEPKGSATRAQVAKIYSVFHKDYIA